MSEGGYRYMWNFVFFDLPVQTKSQRRSAQMFRKFLLSDGYIMMQYSVYARPCNGPESIEKHRLRLKTALPELGQVRSLAITDAQYGRMILHIGEKTPKEKKSGPVQLSFF
jgi:CRISPR-associated protein Cas2